MAKLFTDDQLRRKDIDTLKRWLRFRMGGYGVTIAFADKGQSIFRGVPWPTRPNRVADLSYCPAPLARQGRANREGRTMFYGTLGGPVVFYELRSRPGQYVAHSDWEIVNTFWMHNLGYHDDALRRMGAPESLDARRSLFRYPGDTKEIAKLRGQIALAFTEDIRPGEEFRYKLSIAIAEILFDRADPIPIRPDGPQFDRVGGLAYPALRLRGAADNVAVYPDFVEACLRLKSARYVRVEAVDEQRAAYKLLTLAVAENFPDGQIVWRDVSNDAEAPRQTIIGLESGQWVQRNGLGRIMSQRPASVLPHVL